MRASGIEVGSCPGLSRRADLIDVEDVVLMLVGDVQLIVHVTQR